MAIRNIEVDSYPQGIPFGLSSSAVKIPRQTDWTYKGIALSNGSSGAWDAILFQPCGMVKKDGKYFLYYVAGDVLRLPDEPDHRYLGVATSTDGIHFTKYSGNPIITFTVYGGPEEGIFSAGVDLDESGNVILYAGTMQNVSPTSYLVDGDITLYISSTGYDFTNMGDVVSHADSRVWGYGDELFPTGAFHHDGNWYVYYIAKDGSRGIMWDIGLAWGPSKNNLSNTKEVLSMTPEIIDCIPVKISAETVVLFFKITWDGVIDIRTAPISSPATVTPVESYSLADVKGAMIVFYDADVRTWFMYYFFSANYPSDASIRVRTATA